MKLNSGMVQHPAQGKNQKLTGLQVIEVISDER